MKKILTISLIAASLPALAGSYQSEVNAAYASGKIDDSTTKTDFDTWAVGGTYYLADVSTKKGPLAEAAFLGKASSLSAIISADKYKPDAPADDLDFNNFQLGAHVVTPSGVIATVNYIDLGNPWIDENVRTMAIGVGRYLNSHNAVTFNFSTTLNKSKIDTDTKTYGAKYHGYQSLSGDMAVSYDASLDYIKVAYDAGYNDEGMDAGAGVTFYPMRNLGLGLALSQTDVGDVKTTGYSADAQYFFTDNIAASLAYSMDKVDNDNAAHTVDIDQVMLGVTVRF